MNWIPQWRPRASDLSDEMSSHVEERTEELVKEGMDSSLARSVALREFGNPTLLAEQAREVWRRPLIDDIGSDIRYAFRQLRKAPAFAFTSILTLALGIGANTAVFSVVEAVLLRPLPFPEASRLVSFESRGIRGGPHAEELSYPAFFDFRSSNHVFEHLVSYRDTSMSLSEAGLPVNLRGEIVSWDLFDALKTPLAAGRGFLPQEEQPGQRVVVLSHDVWAERFGGDRTIIGRAITLDRRPYTVVGIAPAGFNFPVSSRRVQVWTTLAIDAASDTVEPIAKQRGARLLDVIGRLRPGVTIERAQREMDAIAARLARQYPDEMKNVPGTYVHPEVDTMLGESREAILILLGAVGLVLLVACANVANLLLARTAEREREFAVRASIGAGRGRIIRQLLTESVTFAVLGSAAGLLVAYATIQLALPLAGDTIPRLEQTTIDARVLVFSIGLAFATALLFSVAPAVRLSRMELVHPLKEGARTNTGGRDQIRATLVGAQVALGLVLLTGAGMLGSSFINLVKRDVGFRPRGLVSFSVGLPAELQHGSRFVPFYSQLAQRLRALPTVASTSYGVPLPLEGDRLQVSFDIEERPRPPSEHPTSDMALVDPNYFATLGVPVLEGRGFTERDDLKTPPVLVVNQAFADKFFPGEKVIGKRIKPGAGAEGSPEQMRQIVGVVGSARQAATGAAPDPVYYFPVKQLPWCCPTVIVRSTGAPLTLEPAIRAIVKTMDRQAPVYQFRTMQERFQEGIGRPRFQAILSTGFAAIALLLTAVGLYGILAYSVLRRTRELGLRIALGATRRSVVRMVLNDVLLVVGAGTIAGLAGALAADRLARKMVTAAAIPQPALLAIAVAVIAGTAALAAYIPARRAASIDPMKALRVE